MHTCCRLYCAMSVYVKMWRAASVLSTHSVDCQGVQISSEREEHLWTTKKKFSLRSGSPRIPTCAPIVVLLTELTKTKMLEAARFVGDVVRGFPPLCRVFTPAWFLMAQLVDWESLEMCVMYWVSYVFMCRGRRKSEWGRWCARCKRLTEITTKGWDMCNRFFSGAQRWNAIRDYPSTEYLCRIKSGKKKL